LRRSASGQLSFVFADNPQGSGHTAASDASEAKAWLLHTADGKAASEADAQAGGPIDTACLLERAASAGNLSRALLNVARNKGAAGVDGRSVEEVVGAARTLLPKLRESLRSGRYQPGAIRRVWIPKPGGGERGLGNAEFPSGNAPTTFVRRLISRISRSSGLFVRSRVQCSRGKPM